MDANETAHLPVNMIMERGLLKPNVQPYDLSSIKWGGDGDPPYPPLKLQVPESDRGSIFAMGYA